MWRSDGLHASQIGDGARQFEDTMEGARRELQPLHRRSQEGLRRWLDLTKRAYLRWAHLGVAGDSWRAGEAPRLDCSRRPHALAHCRRALGLVAIRQLLVVYARRLDVDINAI
jgi:hypothetical protein